MGYSLEPKTVVPTRMLPPNNMAIRQLELEERISEATQGTWRAESLDRGGSFQLELVKKGQARIAGIDDKIVGLCAVGPTDRDSRAHLEDDQGLQVSSDPVSRVADAVLDELRDWKSRARDRMFPIVILNALWVEACDADSRTVKNGSLYIALRVPRRGVRDAS